MMSWWKRVILLPVCLFVCHSSVHLSLCLSACVCRSPQDSCLYLVYDHDPQALFKSFDELQLFEPDQATDIISVCSHFSWWSVIFIYLLWIIFTLNYIADLTASCSHYWQHAVTSTCTGCSKKSSPLKYFTVFSATIWNFDLKFYSFI